MKLAEDAFSLAKEQTRATIAYGIIFAFVVAALRNSLWVGSAETTAAALGMLKDLALIAVSFYFGSKSNGAKP